MAEPLPLPLLVYRGLTWLLTPFAGLLLARRRAKGKEDPERAGERRGIAAAARPEGSLAWVHAASVGETVSVLPLIAAMLARDPALHVLLTTGTVTSARLAATRLPARALHQYAPIDLPLFVARFLDHWRPDLALFVESEIWPNMIAGLEPRGITAVLLNGRMSPRSAKRWARFPKSARWLLSHFSLSLAQSAGDAQRLAASGAAGVVDAGNLKFDVPPPPADDVSLASLRERIGQRPLFLASSTHPGEDEQLAAAHLIVARARPDLLTIVAPRHPQRGGEVAAAFAACGIDAAVRSQGALPAPRHGAYIADTVGELGIFYRLAPIAFIGGSLVTHGGQNPIEPAKLDTAILHGPHVTNFADIYGRLDGSGGARRVSSPQELADAVAALLGSPDEVGDMARKAENVVADMSGALERTLGALAPLLDRGRP